MAGVNGEGLRYYPMAENGTRGFDLATPMKAYQDHQKDLQAQKLAEQAMALRQQGQSEDMRRGQVADQQRAIGMQREERHTQARDDLYNREEERRHGEVLFNRQKLTKAEHEQLIHDLYFPQGEPGTPEYVARQEYAAAALQRAGYRPPEPILEDAPASPGAPAAPSASPGPMGPKDAALSAQLDGIDKTYSKGLGVAPGAGPKDAALSDQLDKIDQTYSKGLGVKPGFIAGRRAPTVPRAGVAQSNAMLDPDDPYNKLVK